MSDWENVSDSDWMPSDEALAAATDFFNALEAGEDPFGDVKPVALDEYIQKLRSMGAVVPKVGP